MSANLSKLYLFKRSNGFYYILFEEEGHRCWKSTRCTFKADALKVLTQFEELLNTKPKTANLAQFTADFLEFAEVNYAKPTVDIATIALRHLQQIAGDCLLTSLTPKHLDLYKTERLQAVRPTSVNVELRALRTIMNAAVRWKLLGSNPFSKMQLVRVPDLPPSYLTKEDFERLLSVIRDGQFRELIIFAVLTGMRRGEILNLRWQDVDLHHKVLQVESGPTFTVKCGKRRTIPLNEVAVHMLRGRLGRSLREYVFTLGGEKFAESHVTHKFKDYVRLAGLNERVKFHSLRHTFATWLVQEGVSIYEVQKLLGHSSISVTEAYAHLATSELHRAVNRIAVSVN
jgi:integrase